MWQVNYRIKWLVDENYETVPRARTVRFTVEADDARAAMAATLPAVEAEVAEAPKLRLLREEIAGVMCLAVSDTEKERHGNHSL